MNFDFAPSKVMNTSRKPLQFTKRKRILFLAFYYSILAVSFVSGTEVILRLKGFEPWRKPDLSATVVPGGKFFQKHPTLGYTHIPGSFTVTLYADRSFNATHLPNTLRITRPTDSYKESRQKEEIWVFGCSLTYGWGLNDEETYPWQLQERFPEYEIVNFGVAGYGTIHSLIQFRDALEFKTPRLAVLAYADFHDERNTFLRSRRKAVTPWNKLGPLVQPYARLDEQGKLRYLFANVEYSEFPMMRHSALVHFIENKYNQYEDRFVHSHAVSEALVIEMARVARERNVKFVVAGISGTRGTFEMLDFAQEHGIPSIDISVDSTVPANTIPIDGHPSAIANRKYADKLAGFLRIEILKPNK